jgi:hypothetical protein
LVDLRRLRDSARTPRSDQLIHTKFFALHAMVPSR